MRFVQLLVTGLLAGAASVAAAQNHTLADDAAAFGSREAVRAPDLSADGSSVLYLTPGPGPALAAVISNLQTGKMQVVAQSDGKPESFDWCRFTSPTRVVCRISAQTNQNNELIGFSRLLTMSTDGTGAKLLGQSQSAYDERRRQYDAKIIDWLGGNGGTVLMERDYVPEAGKLNTRIVRAKSGVGVDRVDTDSLKSDPVEGAMEGASGYMSDGQGKVRLMTIAEFTPQGYLSGRIRYQYRATGSRGWQELVPFQEDGLEPLAIDAGLNRLYALKKRNGRSALYGITLGEALSETLIVDNPKVDIDDVVRFGDGQRVIGYTYAEEKRHAVYFDPEFKALSASLSKAIPHLPLVDFIDSSANGQKLLIRAGSDNDPGRYFLFDRAKETLAEAMLERPRLEGRTLASVKSVTIPAGDGISIPAYLTLPPGSSVKGLPAIILPHGGPSARDEWGFDWLPQFLAARGYAVLQPQFRGSAGFGDAWLNKNGFRNWRTSIGDVTMSAKWLISQGIANPNKLAIVGWSYGGYAALQSAAIEPLLYKAVVAIAPVADLQRWKEDHANFTSRRIVEQIIGSGPHVAEGSPRRNVAAIQAPVLLVHGDLDANVRYAHSVEMDKSLRAAGKTSELITFKGLDHYLDDGSARIEMLTKIGQLLDRTIGQ
ncbi:MAG: alpha/beta hydrolase family protein [Sphingomicrobium sp.]